MILSISWKNVWRNKSRSLIVVCAVTLGTVAGVFVAGLMKGWVDQRIAAAIYTEMGHVKVQNPQYLVNEEISYTIPNITELKEYLDYSKEVKAYSFRSKVMAMASTARGSTGIILKGIDPDKEKLVSDIYTKIIPESGNYFETHTKLPQVVISNKTAEQLRIKNYRLNLAALDTLRKLGVPDESVKKLEPILNKRFLTDKKFKTAMAEIWTEAEVKKFGHPLMSTAMYYQSRAKITCSFTKANGNLGYQTYQVCGVFKTANTMFDQASAFVKAEDLARAAELSDDQFHEVSIILTENGKKSVEFRDKITDRFKDLNAMTWKELAPDAGMMADFMQVYYYMIMGIIFFALAFGIINTMLMAILERIKELGMLMAIGMKKVKVFQMIMLETILLTLTGSTIGMILGGILIAVTGKTGLNFSSVAEGFEAIGWSAVVYPSIETSFFIGVTIMVIGIAVLSSIIPARKALQLKPVEALRIE